jgi:DNA-directed RNA polymerase subunit K/omega
MADTMDQFDSASASAAPTDPRPTAPPIESRFLFVDVAAMRAKQLRRGARGRLEEAEAADAPPPAARPVKSERLAMEEVRRGLVLYEVVEPKTAGA